jgi:DNA-binding NarL/FixJ family response regulator
MSAMDYGGPERRRGGPDRRAAGEKTRILIVTTTPCSGGIRNILEKEGLRYRRRGRRQPERLRHRSRDLAGHHPHGPLAPPPGASGRRRIKRELPSSAIIVLAVSEDGDALFDAIRPVPPRSSSRDVGPDDLVTIVRQVFLGEYLINDKVFAKPAVASRVLKEFRASWPSTARRAPIFAPLSPREVEILDNSAQGMTNKQVAYALSISEQTVKNHMSSILRKLSVNDRTQAVVYAMRQGWIRMPED